MEPIRELIAAAEGESRLPEGHDDRFTGYGVMGLPFSTGHVLALRRFPASSVGPGYSAVWLRRPSGSWVMYADVSPALSCPRYFGSAVESASDHRIDIAWQDDRRFTVDIGDDVGLHWEVSLASTPVTRMMSAFSSAVPAALWSNRTFLKVMGAAAGPALRAGRIGLTGRAPNGQDFRANPRRMWFIPRSTARLQGEDLGSVRALPVQARLGDFWIPQRGIFMMGSSRFEAVED